MNKPRKQSPDLQTESVTSSVRDLSIKNSDSVSVSPCSSTAASGSEVSGFVKPNNGSLIKLEEINGGSEKSGSLSLSSASVNGVHFHDNVVIAWF
ncbi:1 2-dihydroxy-3-keto-5-methylthiopentene dioxygenase [Bienertia sinuspersici]